jgi:hypothetical protein
VYDVHVTLTVHDVQTTLPQVHVWAYTFNSSDIIMVDNRPHTLYNPSPLVYKRDREPFLLRQAILVQTILAQANT